MTGLLSTFLFVLVMGALYFAVVGRSGLLERYLRRTEVRRLAQPQDGARSVAAVEPAVDASAGDADRSLDPRFEAGGVDRPRLHESSRRVHH